MQKQALRDISNLRRCGDSGCYGRLARVAAWSWGVASLR